MLVLIKIPHKSWASAVRRTQDGVIWFSHADQPQASSGTVADYFVDIWAKEGQMWISSILAQSQRLHKFWARSEKNGPDLVSFITTGQYWC